jgi:hypothetical protein
MSNTDFAAFFRFRVSFYFRVFFVTLLTFPFLPFSFFLVFSLLLVLFIGEILDSSMTEEQGGWLVWRVVAVRIVDYREEQVNAAARVTE